MNTAQLASASAQTWNKKNLPSDIERFDQPNQVRTILRQLPAAAVGFARRRPSLLVASAAVLVGVGLAWYLASRD